MQELTDDSDKIRPVAPAVASKKNAKKARQDLQRAGLAQAAAAAADTIVNSGGGTVGVISMPASAAAEVLHHFNSNNSKMAEPANADSGTAAMHGPICTASFAAPPPLQTAGQPTSSA